MQREFSTLESGRLHSLVNISEPHGCGPRGPWLTLIAVRLTIEIHDDEGAVAGWLEGDGHPRRPFVGMLELIALLDAVRGVRSVAGEEDGRTDLGD